MRECTLSADWGRGTVASSGKHETNSTTPKEVGNFFYPAKRFRSTSLATIKPSQLDYFR